MKIFTDDMKIDDEEWKDIDETYKISNFGRVIFFRNKKWYLSNVKNDRVSIHAKKMQVSTLVLKTFKNIELTSKEYIKHLDGNEENNCIENLIVDTKSNRYKQLAKEGKFDNFIHSTTKNDVLIEPYEYTDENNVKWKSIHGYEGLYEIGTNGHIKYLTKDGSKHNMSINNNGKKGYLIVQLRKNGQRSSELVHRLVMENFHPLENMNDLQVNHIDGNNKNNDISNLEWVTAKENMKHANDNGLVNNQSVFFKYKGKEYFHIHEIMKEYDLSVQEAQNVVERVPIREAVYVKRWKIENDLPNEKWEIVEGYNCEISNYGRCLIYVDNHRFKCTLKQIRKDKYYNLTDMYGHRKDYMIAKLVLHAFTDYQDEKIQYKDGNELNFKLENLIWKK